MEDLHKIGGVPALLKYLLNHTDLIDGSQLTVTGLTLAENVQDAPEIEFNNQKVVRPLDNPIKPIGHITILRGSLCPGTAVAKLTGAEGARFEVSRLCGANGVIESQAWITSLNLAVNSVPPSVHVLMRIIFIL